MVTYQHYSDCKLRYTEAYIDNSLPPTKSYPTQHNQHQRLQGETLVDCNFYFLTNHEFQNLQNEHNMHGNDVHDTLTSGPLGLGDEVVGY